MRSSVERQQERCHSSLLKGNREAVPAASYTGLEATRQHHAPTASPTTTPAMPPAAPMARRIGSAWVARAFRNAKPQDAAGGAEQGAGRRASQRPVWERPAAWRPAEQAAGQEGADQRHGESGRDDHQEPVHGQQAPAVRRHQARDEIGQRRVSGCQRGDTHGGERHERDDDDAARRSTGRRVLHQFTSVGV